MTEVDLFIPSAVCVPLFRRQDHLHLVLTKRSMAVRVHKGQVCFPGGVWEESDGGLVATALRETEEELGIPKNAVRIVGQLAGTSTSTGFYISPFVAMVSPDCVFNPSPREIDRLIFAPLRELVRIGGGYYFSRGEWIWGATARIIDQFLERF